MDVLHDNPNVIDQKYLLRYDSFKEFVGKEEKSRLQSEMEGEQTDTPDDIFEESYQKINQNLADDILTEVMKLSPVSFEKWYWILWKRWGMEHIVQQGEPTMKVLMASSWKINWDLI